VVGSRFAGAVMKVLCRPACSVLMMCPAAMGFWLAESARRLFSSCCWTSDCQQHKLQSKANRANQVENLEASNLSAIG
jgi:hypothetical protein